MEKLKKWFLIWGLFMFLALLLYSFFGPSGKKINVRQVNYNYTQSAELFFKNMRAYFYDQKKYEDGSYVLYRINSRVKDSSLNKLNVVLVKNTLLSQCFVRLESGMLDIEHDSLNAIWKTEDEQGSFYLTSSNSDGHYLFAAELYEYLDMEADLYFQDTSKKLRLTEQEKKSLRKSLYDYFRLVGKVR
ncbi:MAG: hypothetical protein RIC95_01635 [Vicingaceae bacterium]